MGRKSNWKSGQTTAIRIPEQFADRLVDLARAWDEGAAPPGQLPQAAGEGAAVPHTHVGTAHAHVRTAHAHVGTAHAHVEPLSAMDQLMSPLNPAECWFVWDGKPVKGRAVGCLVDWSSGLVSAVLIDWELDGHPKQIQLPLDRVEFCTESRTAPTWEGRLVDGYLFWLIPQCKRLGVEPWDVLKRLMQVWRRNETTERSA